MSEDAQALPYVEDEMGRRLHYKFKPSKIVGAPLLIILHGQGYTTPAKFQQDDLNVLCPIDFYGIDSLGSWWLGEDGDFFVMRLLHKLVQQIRCDHSISGKLLFWGSSMGGFGAILHGTLLNADGVYANCPQVVLLGSDYAAEPNEKYFKKVFGTTNPGNAYNDASAALNGNVKTAYVISQSCFTYRNYIKQQIFYLAEKLANYNIAFQLDILPVSGHRVLRPLEESVGMLRKVAGC